MSDAVPASDGALRRRLLRNCAATAVAVRPQCVLCRDMGWLRIFVGPEAWRCEVRRCSCQRAADERRAWERARAASDLSDEQAALTFDGYDARHNRAALAAAQAWARDADGAVVPTSPAGPPASSPPWLVLWGGMGTGKTHLLSAAFNALLAAGKHPVYAVMPLLLDHIRAGIASADKGEYGERFEAVMRAPLLVLDDLGAERRSEWTDEALFKLLDWRYRHRLATACASNFHPDELEGRIGSRLQDRRLAVIVEMAGPDYRRLSPSSPSSLSSS